MINQIENIIRNENYDKEPNRISGIVKSNYKN